MGTPSVMKQASDTFVAASRKIGRLMWTLFLFTKSDIKTTLIPIVSPSFSLRYYSEISYKAIAGVVAAPVYSLRNLVEEVLWIWLHLLAFTTSNQSCSKTAVIEDADNKPDRPIPSGRLTLLQARILRWSLVPICLAVSYRISPSVLMASAAVIMITAWYNEFGGGGSHWFIRNLLNGIGFGAFETGATLLAGEIFPYSPVRFAHSSPQGRDRAEFDIVATRAILISISIYATTTHTQDFKDVEGDIKIKRSTVPLDNPRIARPSVLFGLIAWSLLLSHIWDLDGVTTTALCSLGIHVGVRFCKKNGRKNDQISFYWYNVSIFPHLKLNPGLICVPKSFGSPSLTRYLDGIVFSLCNSVIT